ncbi:hypothetical protein ACB035_13985, partial [Aeromonas sp. S12(2024)]
GMKRYAHDADLKRMVVIRSPSPQLVPFKRHRFGKQRRANLFALITFNGWDPRYNLITGEAELADADGERLGGSEAGQRSALLDACQLAGVPDASIDEHLTAICERHSYHPVRHRLERGTGYHASMR